MSTENRVVYKLSHMYEYGDNCEYDEHKELGIYSTRAKAEEAIRRYITLPGFNKYPVNCFFIDEYVVDNDSEWTEGFMTAEEIEQYQEENNICRGDEYKKSIYKKET